MSVKYLTKAELEEHDIDHERQWIMVDNKILDITDYKYSHPGGDEILLEHAGADATDSFNSVGHSADARKDLDDFIVGELHPDELKKGGASTAASSSSSTSSSAPATTGGDDGQAKSSSSSSGSGGISGIVKYVLVPAIIFATAFGIQKFMVHNAK